MKQFLLRSNVLGRMKMIVRQAEDTKNPEAVKIATKAYNVVMSSPIEKRIYCQRCGKKIENGCEWCKPSKNGDYAMSAFMNPNNPEQEATLSVYGGWIVIEIKMEDNSPKARMAVKINHCPFCGRAFER